MTIAVASIIPPDPLQHNVPIVDAQGKPTPQFIQQWLKSRAAVTIIDENTGVVAEGVDAVSETLGSDYYTKAEIDAFGIPFVLNDGTQITLPLSHG